MTGIKIAYSANEQRNILYKPNITFVFITNYQRIYHNDLHGSFSLIESKLGIVEGFKNQNDQTT